MDFVPIDRTRRFRRDEKIPRRKKRDGATDRVYLAPLSTSIDHGYRSEEMLLRSTRFECCDCSFLIHGETDVRFDDRKERSATRLSGRNNPSRITYSGDAWWTLIQKGRGRDWQCQGSGMKRRGGGNRSARRVICIHVRCCLATWQPGRPARPRTFSLPSPSDSFSRFSSCLRSPPRCPSRRAGLTYVPHRSLSSETRLPRRSRFHGREPSH